jgi:peptide/nickel transport system permease protein
VLQQAPWVDIFPGLAIALAVVAFLLIGDGLRRVYDPYGVGELVAETSGSVNE